MWRSLLALNLLLAGSVLAAESSVGPVSESEAQVLWKLSQSFYKEANCEDAVPRLRRLVDRYPGHPTAMDYRLARFQLGRCYFNLGKYKEAHQELKAYLEGTGDHPNKDEAQLLMGDSLLQMKRLHEALLTSKELEKSSLPESRSQAFTLKARVLIAMKRNSQAELAAATALDLAQKAKSPKLSAEAQAVQLELVTISCGQHPVKGSKIALEESKVRSEIEARGTCLDEAMILYRQVLSHENSASSDRAVALMSNAFSDFHQACLNPPNPPRLKPKNRTAAQIKSYRAELTDELFRIYDAHRSNALKLISNWKQETPVPSESVLKRLQTLEESLK